MPQTRNTVLQCAGVDESYRRQFIILFHFLKTFHPFSFGDWIFRGLGLRIFLKFDIVKLKFRVHDDNDDKEKGERLFNRPEPVNYIRNIFNDPKNVSLGKYHRPVLLNFFLGKLYYSTMRI